MERNNTRQHISSIGSEGTTSAVTVHERGADALVKGMRQPHLPAPERLYQRERASRIDEVTSLKTDG